MIERAKTVEAKYKAGDKVKLKNTWSMQLNNDGLDAEVTGVRQGPDGELIYNVLAHRPPVPCSVKESELEK